MSNNLEEYSDPISYDIENDAYTGELDLLTEWAINQGGPIIDLACGTGRMTIPLAQKGFHLIGVDLHAGMLERAKLKAHDQNIKIEWIEQDCTALQLKQKSPLIFMVGNSFQHFHTNEQQNLVLRSIHNHLEKDGTFIFGIRFPNAEELLQPSTEEYWKTYTDTVEDKKVDVFTISEYDPLEQIQLYTTIRKYMDENDKVLEERKTNISLRYTYPKEMERLLTENGLDILHVYKDWKGSPLSRDSDEMIYVCRKG
ncbi:class I SAM-dependent methyltransferase [Psychrobacillus antarcticus]|uniref:class I SAM-dependent methyltransferase n=1 Tax=Psychrobacillus antarcticus TaxID=2879115 RepID=UPI0024085F70|nr:class I SAM-dependent methyltransferase [Psychrobacillus antarcticus]